MQKEGNEMYYDVAVVGGGPAGMIAAAQASALGARVILLEKNRVLGKKFLLTGGGRCNLTNAIFDNRALAEHYGEKGKFLLSPLSQWNVRNSIEFFESRGMPTKIEAEGRVFPQSDNAQSVLDVLLADLKKYQVKIVTDSPVTTILHNKGGVIGVETPHGIIHAKSYILATGGTSRPETGSTGDGFNWLRELGHTISTPEPSLVPIKVAEQWVKDLQGLSFPAVKTTIIKDKKVHETRMGKILFTHFGISGPLILNMSRMIGDLMREHAVVLSLDLFPSLDEQALDEKMRAHLAGAQNKKWRNAFTGFFPPLFIPIALRLSLINPETFVNKISRADRLAFIKKLKDLRITPTGLLGPEKAIVSSGGIALPEVDFKAMRSRKVGNLYLAGDILDFDRPSGGFSLQICWTTGFVAGTSAAKSAKE